MLYWQSNYVEMSISWEANRSSPSQEIPCILWKLKVHYCVHKRQQFFASCITMSSPSHFFKIHFNIILPATSSSFSHKSFPTKPCMHLSSHLYEPHFLPIWPFFRCHTNSSVNIPLQKNTSADNQHTDNPLYCQMWLNFRSVAKVQKLFTLFTTTLIKYPSSHVFIKQWYIQLHTQNV